MKLIYSRRKADLMPVLRRCVIPPHKHPRYPLHVRWKIVAAGGRWMNVLEFTALVGVGSFLAGLLGSLTGLGGGVVLVPLLTIFFKVDIRYAIGASLVSVIATSSGAAASYVKEGFSNIRIGMFLEIATTLGALAGALIATRVSTATIAIVFGFVLLYSTYLSIRTQPPHTIDEKQDSLARAL